ncbi:hypothetical protein AMELA_G00199390 [Ameiurus melas]|uniref:UPAR/Ly6 domain-containing protein n=1 Tax=Ameiurus melas TaxID=219545 RepID=A0A7J6A8X1_AMEME|nr:hypothetical protein AMELA_G00199390 [Ameiurus melas]
MKSQVILLLICMLFSKALSLSCQMCSTTSGPCPNTQTGTCPDQCLTSTVSVNISGTTLTNWYLKSCNMTELCGSGSLNLGVVKVTNNGQCCGTDLCNTETPSVLPKQDPNGRTCYTCDANSCSGKVSCTGNEDRCISGSFQPLANTVPLKGCASQNLCIGSGSVSLLGITISDVKCCEGNLCNGAESFTLSFLLMLVPLLSSVLFY